MSTNHLVKEIKIEVVYKSTPYNRKVAASDKSNLPLPDQIVSDWRNFIHRVENILENKGYSVIDKRTSNRTNSCSTYLTCVPKDEKNVYTFNFIIIARIFDHNLEDNRDQEQYNYDKHVYIPQLEEKYKVTVKDWQPEEIIINNKFLPTYRDAIRYVADMIDTWEQSYLDIL